VKTPPRPPAGHVAVAAAALWLLVLCALAATSSLVVLSLVVIAPLIAATAADERRTAIVALATVLLTLSEGFWHAQTEGANSWIPLTAACTVSVPAVVLAGVRRRREEHLVRMTAIARTAQVALLPPLPPEITGISIAARYRSATPDASVGGDLYEIIPTGHGIRMIIGDVRGHGLDAVLVARYVLSAFRRSAVAVPALEHVAGEVSRAIRPHLGEEDFVTAVLAQIAPSGELTVVNCGHHPPLLHHGGGLRPLTGTTAAMPLGLEDDFTAFTARWLPGDRLLLYTDGLVESRNQHGDFLPEDQIATAILAADCDQALDALMTAVRRNTGRHGHDDVALLLLEHGAYPHTSAKEQPRPGRCEDASARAQFPA
jgi:phosphoserine phosphatase RsbU/P